VLSGWGRTFCCCFMLLIGSCGACVGSGKIPGSQVVTAAGSPLHNIRLVDLENFASAPTGYSTGRQVSITSSFDFRFVNIRLQTLFLSVGGKSSGVFWDLFLVVLFLANWACSS